MTSTQSSASRRLVWRALVPCLAAGCAGLAILAQAPAGAPAPSGQAPGPDSAASQPAAQGRGAARGGRGPGGAQKDAPINANVDWTKQPSVLPKRPAEELKNIILQPGY